MDINSISSLTSAQTKLMLANVKTRAAETAQSEEKTSAAKTETKASSSSTATTTTTATTTDTSSTTSDTARIAALEAKLENGQDLTSEEIKYLNKVSPGTYEKLVKQRTETTDYTKALTSASSDADAVAVHMNKLSDFLTETKSIANDSSLSDEEKIKMYQSVTTRLNAVENITSMFNSGDADAQSSITAFQNLLSASGNASQQATMLRYNKSLASDMLNAADETTSSTTSTVSSAAKTAGKTSTKYSDVTASTEKAVETSSTEKVATTEKTKTVSETISAIRTIISTETANATQNGVKTAGLNLLI